MAWKLLITQKSEVDSQGVFEVRGDIIDKDNGVVVATYPNYTFTGKTREEIITKAMGVVAVIKDGKREIKRLTVGEEVDL